MSDDQRRAVVAECLEIMGLKLLAECVKASESKDIGGYAEIAKNEAEKRNEVFIAERMRMI
jgi:hypothetical protein